MKVIYLKLKENSYNIYLSNNTVDKIPSYLHHSNIGNFCIIITNRKVFCLHKDKIKKITQNIPHKIIEVTDGERCKSKEWVFKIINELIKVDDIEKKVFIICVGGGTIGDLGGFVASIYKRGIPYIQVPTTLLGCVDASIGGKTAINLKEAKNIVGTFYQPKSVFVDLRFLDTLPFRELKQGFAEVIKYAVIKDRALFNFLEANYQRVKRLENKFISSVIEKCIRIKAQIVERDEKEKRGIRTILNFGHTLGHALEASLGYQKKLTHGEAVALGMVCASFISFSLGLCSKKEKERIEKLIELYSLPTKLSFSPQRVLRSLSLDKKFIGGIRIVLLERIGKTKVCKDVSLDLIKKSLRIIKKLG